MDPPDHRHMRSLLNKAFTPRAIQSQRETVVELVEHYLGQGRSGRLRRRAGLLRPVPRRGHHPDGRVCPRTSASRSGTGSTTACTAKPGQIELERGRTCRPTSTPAMYYYGLVQERRENPQDDMISRLIAAEIPGEDGEYAQARRHRDHRLRSAAGRRGRGDGHQAGRQRGGACSRSIPTSGRSCSTTAARSRPRSRSCCATRPGAVQRPLQHQGRRTARRHDPGGQARSS